jgi:tetratricopeptide (TPR) repeat protein
MPPGVWSLSAAIHQQREDLKKAEDEYRRDLSLFRAAGDQQGVVDVLLRLFYLDWMQTEYRQAFLSASEAWREAEKAQDPLLKVRSAQNLFTILYEVGDRDGAKRALEAAQGMLEGQDRKVQARFLGNRGVLLADEGRLALARRDLERALKLGQGSSDSFFRRAHLNLTDVSLSGDEIERASHHLEEAWKHAESEEKPETSLLYYRARVELALGRLEAADQALTAALSAEPVPAWAWELEYQRGLLEEARGRHGAAEAAYKRSIAIVEEMRRSLGFDEFKTWLLDKKRQPFEALFRLQARSGRVMEALATAERAQARTLLDAFLYSSVASSPAASQGWSPDASLARLEALQSLLPAMSQSPVAVMRPIDQVLAAFGDRDGLIFFESGDELWLITIAGGRARLRALAVPVPEVRRLVGRFLAHPQDAATAERLGDALLPPGSLPGSQRDLYIVADGVVGNLPFAALRRGRRYLVEDHPLIFIPSLSAWAALEDSREVSPGSSLVLADPRGDLPAAAAEGSQVAKFLGATVQTARRATAGELAKASRARVLHLATHTGLGPRGPWLELADRRVSAAEIVTGRIGPRLVVLASCASGVRSGRQMWGSLGASFLAAGSRAVLASLWSIGDEPARDLVLRFYAERGAADPAGALARAQRVAISRGQSPTVWAPFVVFGSGHY